MKLTESLLEVHSINSSNKAVLRSNRECAFPLNEGGQPHRDMTSRESKITSLHQIIDWLDVEVSMRYKKMEIRKWLWKKRVKTFCNIYAYDFCCLSGVYLPRIWWINEADIASLRAGNQVDPKNRSGEVHANMIYAWFEDYGAEFGWTSVAEINDLQVAANDGKVSIITAEKSRSNGHITVVTPETESFTATRKNIDGNMTVINPVESQAGLNNKKYITKSSQWWLGSGFTGYGFWVHE